MIQQPRLAHYGMHGRDITAYQRAYQALGLRPKALVAAGEFGSHTYTETKDFQAKHALARDGVIGPETYAHLYPTLAKDKYSLWLLEHTPVATVQDRIVSTAMYGYHKNALIHYTEDEPPRMDWLLYKWHTPKYPTDTDCSGFSDWVFWNANAPDPAGQGYRSSGIVYTGTMLQHGVRIYEPKIGCLCFYYSPISHVAVYIGKGMVVSHGTESGPSLLPFNYNSALAEMRYYL